jgi:hypothetical protein
MEPPEIPKQKRALDQSPLDVSPEIAGIHQAYKQIRTLGHMSYEQFTVDALVALSEYTRSETPHRLIRQTEMNTAEVLREWDIDTLELDPNDEMCLQIVEAYHLIGDDPRRREALDVLFKLYLICTATPQHLYQNVNITQHIRRILKPSPQYTLHVVPNED